MGLWKELVMAIFSLIIRFFTLPAVLTGAMAALLWLGGGLSAAEVLAAEICLMFIPLLAYPTGAVGFPKGSARRSRQRTFAMVFSAVGYLLGLCWGFAGDLLGKMQNFFFRIQLKKQKHWQNFFLFKNTKIFLRQLKTNVQI